MLIGSAVFDFTLQGKIKKVNNIEECFNDVGNEIVVLRYSTPDIVLLFDKVKCVICETGGCTCHLAMLALEMSVPCVVGVKGIMDLADGTNVFVKSKNGTGEIYEIGTI